MFKLVNLIIFFILINHYGQMKRLSFNGQKFDNDFRKTTIYSSKKYDFKESFRKNFSHFKTKSIDLDSSESELGISEDKTPTYFENNEIVKKQSQRFGKLFDIDGNANQTSDLSSNFLKSDFSRKESELNPSTIESNKKKWRLVSSSTLSYTSIENDEMNKNNSLKSSVRQRKREAKKKKDTNLMFKFKEPNVLNDESDYKIINTTVYGVDQKNNIKFNFDDAIDFDNESTNSTIKKHYKKNQNDASNQKSQLKEESRKISRKIMLAAMIPSMIKGLTSSNTHVAVIPTTHIAQPGAQPIALMPTIQPIRVPMPKMHVVPQFPPPHLLYPLVRRPPPQIISQPIIHQQPIIQQPVIHRYPIVQKKIIAQPIIIDKSVARVAEQPQIYQRISVSPDQNHNVQNIPDDFGEDITNDFIENEDDASIDHNEYGYHSWQEQKQQVVVPQSVMQEQPQDSWGNQPNVQNQKIYHYHTSSVPKSTRTIYTQTKMIPSITSIHSTTSYTPEHKYMIVETEHNMKPPMNLIGTLHRKIISKPVYNLKVIQRPAMPTFGQQPTYVSDNQGSWCK